MKIIAACIWRYDYLMGIDNKLPWPTLRKDMQHFREVTKDYAVIMGRRTHESIGKALPDRLNIVVSSTMQPTFDICVVPCLSDALKIAKVTGREPCIIGGAALYDEAMQHTMPHTLYLSLLEPPPGWRIPPYDTDVYFPFDRHRARYILKSSSEWTENGWRCHSQIYTSMNTTERNLITVLAEYVALVHSPETSLGPAKIKKDLETIKHWTDIMDYREGLDLIGLRRALDMCDEGLHLETEYDCCECYDSSE